VVIGIGNQASPFLENATMETTTIDARVTQGGNTVAKLGRRSNIVEIAGDKIYVYRTAKGWFVRAEMGKTAIGQQPTRQRAIDFATRHIDSIRYLLLFDSRRTSRD
jgi:hypothetical protein